MIEITKESEDRLSQKRYLFYVSNSLNGSDIYVYLDKYIEADRLTTRHHYKIQKMWQRSMYRNISFTDEEVQSILSPEIVAEVKTIIKKSIDDLVITT